MPARHQLLFFGALTIKPVCAGETLITVVKKKLLT